MLLLKRPNPSTPTTAAPAPAATRSQAKDNSYSLPTTEEMAPLGPEYAAELAKIHEPPEMSGKPMQVRKLVSPKLAELANVMANIGAPDKATHEQRQATIRQLLDVAVNTEQGDAVSQTMLYGAIAMISCLDGEDPNTTIAYATSALGDGDDGLALQSAYVSQGGR